MPVVILGLAGTLSWLGQGIRLWQTAAVVSVFILWNGLFLFQYYTGMIPWDRALTWDELVTDKIDVYRAWEGHVHRHVCQELVSRAAKSEQPGEAAQLLAEASEQADLAVQASPRNPESWICRAFVSAALGDRERAAKSLTEACRHYKDPEYVRRKFLGMLQRAGFSERAREYEPLLEWKPRPGRRDL
jgi:cytochrome c-type biogenesis protein CcmH/NrfG